MTKRSLLVGVGGGLLAGALLVAGAMRGGGASDQELREMAYVGSQLGAAGQSPVTPLYDGQPGGSLVALSVRGVSGRQYVVLVDPGDPSRLLLDEITEPGRQRAAWVLPTKLDKLDLRNARLMESIFRTPGWEAELRPLADREPPLRATRRPAPGGGKGGSARTVGGERARSMD